MSTTVDQKHKTVGVSFHPELRQRAISRARSLGLSFSRYVTLCVESELGERVVPLAAEAAPMPPADSLNLEAAIDEGSEYGAAKARSIGFEEDVDEILRAEDFCYNRMASVAHLRTDFLIQQVADDDERVFKVALECKHNMRGRYTVTLGQTIILQSLPGVDAVLLCVPYTRNFDQHVHETFRQHGIPVTTPDTVVEVLRETFASLERK